MSSDFAWVAAAYAGRIIKCGICNLNLACSGWEENSFHPRQRGNYASHGEPVLLIHISWLQLRLFQAQSAVSFIYSFKLQDYFWLFVLACRVSRYWSAWTIYQVKGLIYQCQKCFVLPLCVAVPYGIVSYVYIVGFRKVIWHARIYHISLLFRKNILWSKVVFYGVW